MPASVLMIQGCTSSAGKSYLASALCRVLANEGVRVAPFKAQNMSNNAGVTKDGLEMGRAQLVQATAAKVTADTRMNPVLLKPESNMRSQVVLLGKADLELSRLPWRERKRQLWPYVKNALHSLVSDFEVVVVEGAGSPAEVNLRDSDIVNMAVALEAQHYGSNVNVLLVSDIDRGGSFAHLLGTWHCFSAEEKNLLKGFVLNRFRGDARLLAPAPQKLEAQTGVPVVGVVPMLDVALPEEDGVRVEQQRASSGGSIGIIRLPRISNLDEFQPLAERVLWVTHPHQLDHVNAVILPGSKNTLPDLEWLRATGLAGAVSRLARRGTPVLGVCGGMQMLGTRLRDSHNIEGGGEAEGLGLLELETVLEPSKITRDTHYRDLELDVELHGYEIHVGVTKGTSKVILERDGEALGWCAGNVRGVYAHGLFENSLYLQVFLQRAGLQGAETLQTLDARLDILATRVRESLDWQRIKSWLA